MLAYQCVNYICNSGFVTDNKADGSWSTRELSKKHPDGVSKISLEVHQDIQESRWIGKIAVG